MLAYNQWSVGGNLSSFRGLSGLSACFARIAVNFSGVISGRARTRRRLGPKTDKIHKN